MISRYLYELLDPLLEAYVENELRQNSLRKTTIRNWLIESLVWSTSLSTSAVSPRQVLVSQPKRSAKTDVYQLPTGTGKTESKLATVSVQLNGR